MGKGGGGNEAYSPRLRCPHLHLRHHQRRLRPKRALPVPVWGSAPVRCADGTASVLQVTILDGREHEFRVFVTLTNS